MLLQRERRAKENLEETVVERTRELRAAQAQLDGEPDPMLAAARSKDDTWRKSINTCHVWDEAGEVVARREAGEPHEAPLFMRPRLDKLGLTMPDGSRTDDH